MHESAVMKDLRAKLVEIARTGGRIRTARLWVGALSPVAAEAIRSHWSEVVTGTPAEGSELVVEVSEDLTDPRARSIVLREVGVEGPVQPTDRGTALTRDSYP